VVAYKGKDTDRAVYEGMSPLCEITCHLGSHPAEVGTRYSNPGVMQG